MKPTSGTKAHDALKASGHSAANTSNHSESIVMSRKERNRLSAKASRQRRQQYIDDVETRLRVANETIVELRTQVHILNQQLSHGAYVSWVDDCELPPQSQ